MSRLCVAEAKYSLMAAAGRAGSARDRGDVNAYAVWVAEADRARELLREACDERGAA